MDCNERSHVEVDKSVTKDLPSDETLLALVADGDRAAMESLHLRHAGLARHIAFRALRNHVLAEDAAQDAFLDLWRTADRFDADRASVRTWLCLLVHRRAVDLARREARRRIADGAVAVLDADSYVLEETVVLESDRQRVRAALDHLNARNRELIELSYYGGLSQSQVAARMGLPLGTVKSATFTALAQLRTVLAA
jgi:RNA polymerase sigma-70 factor (ECF subfamily)